MSRYVLASKKRHRVSQVRLNSTNHTSEDYVRTTSGVQNATSAAGTLLTSDVAVTDEPEEKKDGGMPGGGMPDMGSMGGMM